MVASQEEFEDSKGAIRIVNSVQWFLRKRWKCEDSYTLDTKWWKCLTLAFRNLHWLEIHIKRYNAKEQFTKEEVECTRRIASARIHVERKMEQIKNFRMLQGTLPLALSQVADDIFFICLAMTNLLPPFPKKSLKILKGQSDS
jgi:hypothetical protein